MRDGTVFPARWLMHVLIAAVAVGLSGCTVIRSVTVYVDSPDDPISEFVVPRLANTLSQIPFEVEVCLRIYGLVTTPQEVQLAFNGVPNIGLSVSVTFVTILAPMDDPCVDAPAILDVEAGPFGRFIGAMTADNNVHTRKEIVVYVTDGSFPLVDIAVPPDGTEVPVADLVIDGTAVDVEGVTQLTYQLNGDREADIFDSIQSIHHFSFAVRLVDGPNTITVTAGDADGNTGSQTITVDYDAGSPSPPPLPGDCQGQEFALSVPAGTIQTIPGGTGEVAVFVNWNQGFSDDIELSVTSSNGLDPTDLLADFFFDPNPVTTSDGFANFESLVRGDVTPGTYTLRIVGTSVDDADATCSILQLWEIQ